MKEPWDFVEKWFPNYFSSNIILQIDHLTKIIEGDYEQGDDIDKLFCHTYCGDLDLVHTINNRLVAEVYEESIKNYIENGMDTA